jgi:cystathionine beta-lyase/cystathionine gamma-synthase
MTHSFYTPEERREHLIGEGLVRISAGLDSDSRQGEVKCPPSPST